MDSADESQRGEEEKKASEAAAEKNTPDLLSSVLNGSEWEMRLPKRNHFSSHINENNF